jgi:flagellar biosynthetic protein FliQ
MTTQAVLDMLMEAFRIGLYLSLPVLLTTLVIGVAISVFQSVTSIQEQTMVFVPKILAAFLALLICFSWMMNTALEYTRELFAHIPDIVK